MRRLRRGVSAPCDAYPTGGVIMAQVHITGLVVYTHPAYQREVLQHLPRLAGCELHGAEGNKLVVTVEALEADQTTRAIEQISAMPGVVNVAMTYHHCEDEQSLNQEIRA